MLNYRADPALAPWSSGGHGTRLLDLRMKAPSQSVLPRIDKEADDGRFAKRLSGLQPVQTLNEYEAGAVPLLGSATAGPCRECSPQSRLLAFVRE